jgi:hypothetical protein
MASNWVRALPGLISGNTVTNNEYTGGVESGHGGGDADSSGILVFGGGPYGALTVGVHITGNTLNDNDVGIFSISCGNADCTSLPSTPTVNIIQKNTLSNNEVTNVSGCGDNQGYQAGIQNFGRNDQISKNKISGLGYKANDVDCAGSGPPATLFAIDTTGSNSKVRKNVSP